MNEVLNYNTITENSEGFFKDKGSKFLGFAFHVKTLEDIDRCLKKIREKEYSARHHCYAYRLEFDGSKYRANDDGEPSHSAGDPILGQIDSFELTETLIFWGHKTWCWRPDSGIQSGSQRESTQ
jgi:putative IMPACT (imprinted ancient) family translation regulator